jgi:hypothetical protein
LPCCDLLQLDPHLEIKGVSREAGRVVLVHRKEGWRKPS